jgi:hypothetical protein
VAATVTAREEEGAGQGRREVTRVNIERGFNPGRASSGGRSTGGGRSTTNGHGHG